MKAIDVKQLRSIGLENYYHVLWGQMESDEEFSEPKTELMETPEDELSDVDLKDAIQELENEQSARIVEAIGGRAQLEIERSILDPAGEQFLKGCIKEFIRTHGTYVSDHELSELIKSFK